MNTHASYVYSAYSFIDTLTEEQLCQVGHLSADGIPIPSFDEDLLIKLCQDAKRIFKNEENTIEIDGDAIVVGDIHGSLHDLLRIIKHVLKSDSKVIFLGDYVDRGCFSLECITLLFTLKILKPKRFFLLRGNHEFEDLCSHYGFKSEILNFHNPHKKIKIESETTMQVNENDTTVDDIIFDSEEEEKAEVKKEETKQEDDTYFANHVNIDCHKYSEKLYDAFMKAFSFLPIAAIVNKTSLCLHGGLTPLLHKVENIQTQIQRPIKSFDENLLLSDIVWGDPLENLPEFYCDSHRGRGKLFNGPVLVNFLKNNHLKRIIRGHEMVDGIAKLFNEKCITVFSASSYSTDNGNSSGILKIYQKDDQIESFIFKPLKRLEKSDACYYKVQSFTQKKINRSSLPQISGFKNNNLLLSLDKAIPTSIEHFTHRYKTSSRRNLTENENENKFHAKTSRLISRPRKKFGCVLNYPQIAVPHITKNNKIDF